MSSGPASEKQGRRRPVPVQDCGIGKPYSALECSCAPKIPPPRKDALPSIKLRYHPKRQNLIASVRTTPVEALSKL
jgi:hypothetical protein